MNDQDRVESLTRAMRALVTVLKYAEFSVEEVQNVVKYCFESVELPRGPRTKVKDVGMTGKRAQLLGSVLAQWHNTPEYVDKAGNPIAVEPYGPAPSVEALFNQAANAEPFQAKGMTPEYVVERLIDHGVVRVETNGTMIPLNIVFPANSKTSVGALAQLNFISQFAETVGHNTFEGQGGRFQNIAYSSNFPVAMLSLLKQMVAERGVNILREFDDFMDSHRVSSESDQQRMGVGIGVYMVETHNE